MFEQRIWRIIINQELREHYKDLDIVAIINPYPANVENRVSS
jgi:hypothetical protein